MRISTFFYTIKQGLVNIWKNKMFSLASIATMTACIFLFGLFYSIVTNFQAMVKDAESGVAVTVFFDAGISDQRIEEIGDLIGERVEVSHYELYQQMKHGKVSKMFILMEMKRRLQVLQAITRLPILPAIPFI